MSASIQDINLTVVRGGAKAFCQGVKGCGVLIWDIRMGLFSSETSHEAPHHALEWLTNSNWDDSVELIPGPLKDPVYGYVTIDFDNKHVVDENGYGDSNAMPFDWFYRSVISASKGQDGLISAASVCDHIAHGRISLTEAPDPEKGPLIKLQSHSVEDVVRDCAAMVKAARSQGQYGPTYAVLHLPDGWTFKSMEPRVG